MKIPITDAARHAYEEWINQTRTFRFVVTNNSQVWPVDALPDEALQAGTGLRAWITRPHGRPTPVRVWLEPNTPNSGFGGTHIWNAVILGDYPRPGDLVTLRW